MRKLLLEFLCLAVCSLTVYGQGGYYRPVEGLKKSELKTALYELIQPEKVLDYGGRGEGYTWAGFVATDCMPDGTVRDRYSNEVRKFDGLNAVEGMNIEHSFAKSWWGHTVNNAYCDLFNLFPSDGAANGRKSNHPIGEVTEAPMFDNGVTRVGKSTSYREDSLITVWEPADEWKGDFARTYFYMATCYEDYVDSWQTDEGLLMVEKNRYPTLRSWVSNLLLAWSVADPVDDIERARNEAVCRIQGNRNPFVDYPQLASYIWGDSTEYTFYTTKNEVTPELFIPAEGETVDYGLQALSKGLQGKLVIRGRNLPGGLTLNIDNPEMVTDKVELSEEEVRAGAAITVQCNALSAGEHTATLTLKGQGFEQTNILRVYFVDGVPAYPAEDLTCTVSFKRFTASWMEMGDGLTYAVEVYTKGSDGGRNMLDGYPKQTSNTRLKVENLQASTTYYYSVKVLDGDGMETMASNEVEVIMPEVTPVFTADASEMYFTSIPDRPSMSQTVNITALEVPQYVTTVTTEMPFEVSTDGTEWGEKAVVQGTKQSVWVRMGKVAQEGVSERELILSTPGVKDIVISLVGEADRQKSYFESFEKGNKGGYAEATVTCVASAWRMAQTVIGTLASDQKNNGKSVRMQVKAGMATELEMLDDKTEGCDSLWFYAGLYGKDTGANLSVYYSKDGGMEWIPVVLELAFNKGEWKRYGYKINSDGLIRVKLVASGSSSKRLNVDDIQMSDYCTGGDDIHQVVNEHPDDQVNVYTLSGIYIKTAKRKEALQGLKPDYYIVK